MNHYWTIDEKSTLTTSLYGSMATGGGRRARGAMSNWLTIDNNTGRPKDGAMMTPDGLFDYERAMAANAASQNGSQVIFTNAVNDHDWYGMLSSYKNHLTENLTLTGGIDLRYYKRGIIQRKLMICWVVSSICRPRRWHSKPRTSC